MSALRIDKKIVSALFVLSITQIIGWGTIGLPAIVGRQIANDLQTNISTVFAGTSMLFVIMGLCSPMLAWPFARFGARLVMAVGALAAAPGFIVLSLANGPVLYFVAWAILGVAGAATLTTAAHIELNEIAGRNAKAAIGGLMLVTGLSSSVFWPITAVLADAIGWRGTCLAYAAGMILICAPLYFFGLPRHATRSGEAGSPPGTPAMVPAPARPGTFYLVVAAITLNGFVTFGFASVIVELLKTVGLSSAEAIAFGSALGVLQVSARAVDFLGGGRWDGVTTGLFAGTVLALAMLSLMVGGTAHWSILCFILLYGLGSGALAVARATIPLVFYDKADYARAASRIALPYNLISALAPPFLVDVLTRFGTGALLGLALSCSCGALVMLFLLARHRPSFKAIVPD
jgi:predicted MFS family arabinose efflux permease